MTKVFVERDDLDSGETRYNIVTTDGGIVAIIYEPERNPYHDITVWTAKEVAEAVVRHLNGSVEICRCGHSILSHTDIEDCLGCDCVSYVEGPGMFQDTHHHSGQPIV